MTAIEKVIALAKSEVGYLEKASNKDLDSKTANSGAGCAGRRAVRADKSAGRKNVIYKEESKWHTQTVRS